MFDPPALSLFLYNALLSYVAMRVTRISNGNKESDSLLKYLPILGDYMTPNNKRILDPSMDYVEFPRNMLYLNYVINGMVLMPALMQRRWFGFLLSVVVVWNLFIFERVFVFQLVLIWSLWDKLFRSLTYLLIISCCSFMNALHLMLIFEVIRLQRNCLTAAVANSGEGQAAGAHPLDGRGDGAMP